MTARIKNFYATVIEDAGSQVQFGSLSQPLGDATIGGDHIAPKERYSIEPEDYVILWAQEHRKLKFQQLGFRIIGEGSCIVWWRTDLPTSASDYTALGTRQRWHSKAFGCKGPPFMFWDQTTLSYSTLSDEVADDGDLPKLMTDLIDSADTAVIDRVVVYNPGTSVLLIERLLAQ